MTILFLYSKAKNMIDVFTINEESLATMDSGTAR